MFQSHLSWIIFVTENWYMESRYMSKEEEIFMHLHVHVQLFDFYRTWMKEIAFISYKKSMYLSLKIYCHKNTLHYFPSPLIILAIISYNLNIQNMTPWHWYTGEITSFSLEITLFKVSWYKVAWYFSKRVCCYFVERPHWFMLNNFSLHWYMTAIN